ncbi:FkbM family methyltransferase [Candidatus Woesearchaeota archaeon]|nr:FkbM family methyltransferase [Candidatus Woesearchaeota archaeon]
MWFVTGALNQFLKFFARVYYLGKPRTGTLSVFHFGDVKFYARHNTLDAFALQEIWRYNSYSNAAIKPGYIVLDIGAHIGGYAILAAKRKARVIAYEAMPKTYELLVKNIKANDCKSIKAYNAAVSSRNGKITLHTDSEGTILSSIYPDNSFPNKTLVPSISLHEVIKGNNLKRIDILKIDVEGAEYDILLNAQPADLRKVQTIIMEFHDHLNHGHNRHGLTRFLHRHGFAVRELSLWITTTLFKEGRLLATRQLRAKQQPL